MTKYYRILDLGLIGKNENFIPYLYDMESHKWVVDNKNILTDRLTGHKGKEYGKCCNVIQITEEVVSLYVSNKS